MQTNLKNVLFVKKINFSDVYLPAAYRHKQTKIKTQNFLIKEKDFKRNL